MKSWVGSKGMRVGLDQKVWRVGLDQVSKGMESWVGYESWVGSKGIWRVGLDQKV